VTEPGYIRESGGIDKGDHLRFRRAGLGLIVFPPAGNGGQRNKVLFDTPAGLEAENRSPIVKQIEFDIAAAAKLLEFAFPLAIGNTFAALGDRQVSVQKMIAAIPHEGEEGPKATFQVIEENAADAARLLAMGKVEILVAPLLEPRVIHRRWVALAHRLPRAMKVNHILAKRIIRRQIGAAAEPPAPSLP